MHLRVSPLRDFLLLLKDYTNYAIAALYNPDSRAAIVFPDNASILGVPRAAPRLDNGDAVRECFHRVDGRAPEEKI
jgi:hypothetical protein